MLELFFPDERKRSAYDIDYEAYYAQGYRGILYDIDNTLVGHGAPADARAIGLCRRLRDMGFRICFISNNKEPRVASFNEKIGAEYIFLAKKPAHAGYMRGMKRMGTTKQNTLYIGDQIFTDVWGAKRIGIHSILTEPLYPKEEIQIVLKRIPEKLVLFAYEHRSVR